MGVLIREEVAETQFLVEEDNSSGKKNYFIEGIFMQAEQKNKNGRVYPRQVLMNEAERYNREYIKENRAYGELGHPDSPSINLDRVSHMITKLVPDGNNFIGKAKILDTPNGQIVKGILDGGGKLGVSTRGVGSLKPANGFQIVQDDFRLATAADIVADPSAPQAFVNAVMENKEWVYENGIWAEAKIERAKKVIRATPKAEIENVALKIFENFVSKL